MGTITHLCVCGGGQAELLIDCDDYFSIFPVFFFTRPARNDVPSMYIEEDELNELEEGGGRAAEIRARVAPPTAHLCGGGVGGVPGVGSSGGAIVGVAGPHHYISESFIQYAQPSLNGTIPKSILNKL